MNNTSNYTLQERSIKRANYCTLVTITVISVFLTLLFFPSVFQGTSSLRRSLIITAMVSVPAIICIICYVHNPIASSYRYIALFSYFVIFEVICLSVTTIGYNLFLIPVLISMLMYFDLKFEIRASILNTTFVTINSFYSIFVLGCNSQLEKNGIFLIWTASLVINIAICLAAKVAVLHNEESLAELEARKKKQEEMMESILAVGKSVNSSTQNIHALIEEMSESTNCVSQAMSDIAVSMESTVGNIQEQASMTGQIQDVISDTVDIADTLETISRENSKNVKSGQQLVADIVAQTEQIEQENTMVKDNMAALHTHTKDMQKIIGIIQQISSQTNLLALNASIEAARAGDAGKGFAVVAEEIRILSEQTKQSTENIEEIITKLNSNASDTISSMDVVMEKISTQVTMIHNIEDNFSSIRSGLSDLKHNAAAMGEKTKLLKDSNTTLVDSTNTLSSTSEEISASAEETNAMCSDNAERFKTVNQIIEDLTVEAGKMDGFIDEYNRLHEEASSDNATDKIYRPSIA